MNSVDDGSVYSRNIIALAKNPKHFGRMNDPTSAASIKGPCGDEMEFYLVVKDKVIEEAKFYTKGCISTVVCGEITAELVQGKFINDALGISPKQIKERLKELPETHSHCSILSVSVLYKAIADYLLKK
ncbi:MAG: iron-sulfur cluster assembly scaffold protein [Candidatus Omnitrophica bacterium]|nr:iron-sulfur cluster assembly scaffold protein [Candidatus Omnitrophota bacterium]MBU0878483.1 iron-sulfur cluster assembly scaffold protein [Candidatus Omnitrophota bacterium]MBU0896355.1 iron-sulfur cluster assembly scaffold protein [Candidatus Omnitrophota bacterium]MBU1134434.1 iron-sulfur cluster assembly scaffold protein [Candidatus Omnitrophota bacterium]MBU1367495.1 iron-sulfur cluster assembly scaffold protein [Candidatus Omnitrophota bacterium]